jgi:anaerobic sulfite reductase subunit B
MAPWPATVVGRRVETDDTVTLTLAVPGRDLAGACRPGQFCMLWVPGVGESAISLSGIGADGTVDHTVKRVGAVTGALCGTRPGDVLGLRGPFGRGWDLTVTGVGDLAVVAGGIGLAPLRSLIRHRLAGRAGTGRLAVLVGFRSPSDVLFAAELDDWHRRGAEVHLTVDRAERGWDGEVGVVTRLMGRIGIDPSSSAAVCGPEVMMRSTARDLVERGVAPRRIQVSLERNMRCGVGHCGHCQLGPLLLCRQGPVGRWSDVERLLEVREL